jgi:hypothetical protein
MMSTAASPGRFLAARGRVLGYRVAADRRDGTDLAMSVTGSAGQVGAAAPLAFALAAVGVLVLSAGFVQLSGQFSHAGSVYGVVSRTLGPRDATDCPALPRSHLANALAASERWVSTAVRTPVTQIRCRGRHVRNRSTPVLSEAEGLM